MLEMIGRMNSCLRLAAVATITATLGAGLAGCASHDKALDMPSWQLSKPNNDIIQLATGENMGEMTTLVKLIQAADLTDTLKSSGPFTVFAPTNEAFDALGKDTLEDLMKPENKKKLRTILMYHIHAGDAILSKDISAMNLSTTDAGTSLNVAANGNTIMVNNATVVKPDIVAKNGVIYWIDTVLMPH
jgi:uncharacterized surface protein with fasciclin (FAS1) repeats